MARSDIPIKSYRRDDFRMLLMNPTVNLSDQKSLVGLEPMPKKRFQRLVEKKCKGKVPKEEYKYVKVFSEDVVRLILSEEKNGRTK